MRTYRMEQYIEPDQSVSTILKEAIAELENCRPAQLGTLETVVDIDKLDAIVDSGPLERREDDPPLEFRYCSYLVTVSTDRTLSITP